MSMPSSRGRFLGPVLWLSLLFALLSSVSPQKAHGQETSPQTLTPAEPLWQMLLQATGDLPNLIDAYSLDWQRQVAELQRSNEQLATSNESLTAQNAGLQTSLLQSQADLATSEKERLRSETALRASLASITQAQESARALEEQRNLALIGGVGLSLVLTVLLILK